MKLFTTINLLGLYLILVNSTNSLAQKRDLAAVEDSIRKEADVLYKSEWASWYGGDIFADKCKDKQSMVGGYLSYDTGNGLNNVYFSNSPNPSIVATISFEYDFNSNNYKLNTDTREFNTTEKELFTIRQAALADINRDTLYKRYNNTSLNPVPIINNKAKKVYVLTGPKVNGVVIFGNDYLITFDNDNKLLNRKMLHRNIIPANYGPVNGQIQVGAIHSHLAETGDFITATDICTLRLYQGFTSWNTYTVISPNYVSAWDCKKSDFVILTREAWENISKDVNSRKN